eukprot:gene29663-biopygen28367
MRAADGSGGIGRALLWHVGQYLARDGRTRRQRAAGVGRAGHAQALQQLIDFGHEGGGDRGSGHGGSQ